MSDNYLRMLAKAHEMAIKKEEKKEEPEEQLSITRHSVKLLDENIGFTATAGYMEMKDEEKKVKSKIFFTSYIKDGVTDKSHRPITFAFNGGPGAASIWLHFSALGPKRIKLEDDGEPCPPPYGYDDNPYSWLKFTDLVFIDPVGTGYSRTAKDGKPEEFFGVKEDIHSVGQFIRLFVTKNKRWRSPKFVAGESYGTTRAAGLSGYLQEHLGMDLNGIVLMSSALNFHLLSPELGYDLPYVTYLPTYTATAWFHKKLDDRLLGMELRDVLNEVEHWAFNKYLVYLAKGDTLTEDETNEIIGEIAGYTGLTETCVRNHRLRIHPARFSKEILRDRNLTTGRMDSRYTGMDADSAGEVTEYDPSFFRGPFATAVNDYVRSQLKYENELPYINISMDVNRSWNWTSGNPSGIGMVNIADTLRQEMCKNKHLKVFVACGYYDMATPYFAADYVVTHLGLTPSVRNNIKTGYYEGGHMMYYHKPSMIKLFEDMKEFYRESIPHA